MTKSLQSFEINGIKYFYNDLNTVEKSKLATIPYSHKILLENVLRHHDTDDSHSEDADAIINWNPKSKTTTEISFTPSRVILQDFTGVPAVVDLAAMRDAVSELGGNPNDINPLSPAELVIDHSVQVDHFGTQNALDQNNKIEFERNKERYKFLKWGQESFSNFKVIPPNTGIIHQVNLEYLGRVIFSEQREHGRVAFPDTLVGTDSHTTMINGIGTLGWGVGGIEAEAAMLGQPIFMILPEVIGLKLSGKLNEGITTTDLVLSITEKLRSYGVVEKIVEVFGDGVKNLSVADRATISNMSPEFGCTDTHWPIDEQTLKYLKKSNRSKEIIERVKIYSKINLLWNNNSESIEYTDIINFNISDVVPTISGPKKPQEKIKLNNVKEKTEDIIKNEFNGNLSKENISDGTVVLAAITSCTNTSNPSVMLGAGLIAKKAIKLGLKAKPWVKTSLAPGSKVVTKYLEKSNLLPYLEKLGFNIVGYGCTTCIGNSGDMIPEVQNNVIHNNLTVATVLSGNRNFEARIHPNIKMNFLMSPMLVVIYSLIGRINFKILKEIKTANKYIHPTYANGIVLIEKIN